MIGLDTNVLVRYLVEDDAKQSAEAARLIDRATEQELFIAQIILCELVWVLSHAYGFSRAQIVPVLHQLRRAAQIILEQPDAVRRAIDSYASGKGDFADYLIAGICQSHGCSSVATFDRALLAHEPFRAPSDAL